MVPWGPAARPWVVLAVWLGLSPFWIQKESLWIDEAVSAVVILAPSLDQVWTEISRINATEMHLPAYHYYLWGVAHWVGHSEAALRAANLPWMLLGFTALILAVYARSEPEPGLWMALFLVTSPFLFYYTNEVRPYAMQFGLASLTFAGIAKCLSFNERPLIAWPWLMAVGAVLLAWTTIYGLAWWLMSFFVWLGILRASPWKSRINKAITAFLGLGGLSATLFHVWVIFQGARASAVGATSLKTLAYACGEWAGAAGFLPGRALLRAGASPELGGFLMAAVVGGLVVILWLSGLQKNRLLIGKCWWPCVWFLPALGILASGMVKGFRVVGRHFTPAAPSFFWFLSCGPQNGPGWRWTRFAGIALVALWVWSDVRLATLPEHRKDDYRGAVEYILENLRDGQILWWAADEAAARFYNLKNYTYVGNVDRGVLSFLPKPDWIIMSKPDVYDTSGALVEYIDRHGAAQETVLQSFVIYKIPALNSR